MKKNNILIATLFFSSFAFAQVGINTETPQATLDVAGNHYWAVFASFKQP